MNEILIIGKTYYFEGRFFDRKTGKIPEKLDEGSAKLVVRDERLKIIFEADAELKTDIIQDENGEDITDIYYECAYPVTIDKGIGTLIVRFEGTIGEVPDATNGIRVKRSYIKDEF